MAMAAAQPYTLRPLFERLDALLPQTQCGQCGFAGCKPYAEAMAAGRADINRCPPGGEEGIAELAALLGVAAKPLDPSCGGHTPGQVAFIIEDQCIGCNKCVPACPVDAIVGAAKFMHTVLADECTGCQLCLAPCPVDCIVMRPAPRPLAHKHLRAARARRRHEARCARKAQEAAARAERARLHRAVLASTQPAR